MADAPLPTGQVPISAPVPNGGTGFLNNDSMKPGNSTPPADPASPNPNSSGNVDPANPDTNNTPNNGMDWDKLWENEDTKPAEPTNQPDNSQPNNPGENKTPEQQLRARFEEIGISEFPEFTEQQVADFQANPTAMFNEINSRIQNTMIKTLQSVGQRLKTEREQTEALINNKISSNASSTQLESNLTEQIPTIMNNPAFKPTAIMVAKQLITKGTPHDKIPGLVTEYFDNMKKELGGSDSSQQTEQVKQENWDEFFT